MNADLDLPGYDPYESMNIDPSSIEEAAALIASQAPRHSWLAKAA